LKLSKTLAAGAVLVALLSSLPSAATPAAPSTAIPAAMELPELKNPRDLKWEKTIPSAGKNSPEYAILHVNPKTNLTLLMFRTPMAVQIKPHTH
jgi:hypothetical protein